MLKVKSESDKSVFLDWLESTTLLATSHESDSSPVKFVSSMNPLTQY